MEIEVLADSSSEPETKVRPPFPNLAIFNVSALVLAYAAYADDVSELLNLLSHSSRKYNLEH